MFILYKSYFIFKCDFNGAISAFISIIYFVLRSCIIFTEVALFHLYSPPYSVSKAISTVQNSKSSLIIRQNKEYATMSTTVYLNPFVKAGYVFRCFDNDANKQYNIFFNPISGDFFNIQ